MRTQESRRTGARRLRGIGAVAATTAVSLLSACGFVGLGGAYPGVPDAVDVSRLARYKGPVATPYPAYRIDENRYFEIVPRTDKDCYDSTVVYVDKLKGIRTEMFDTGNLPYQPTLIIDAANDQYLVGPIQRGNTSCSSGGGHCSGLSIPYSTDAGRTWGRTSPPFTYNYEVQIIGGSIFYAGQRADFSPDARSSAPTWRRYYQTKANPLPRIANTPLDTKFYCARARKE